MLFHLYSTRFASRILIFLCLPSLAPTQPLAPSININSAHLFNDSSDALINPSNLSLPPWTVQNADVGNSAGGIGLSSAQGAPNLNFTVIEWEITSTLSLKLRVSPREISQERVMRILELADTAAGKKPGLGLLEKRFKVQEGSGLDKMIFEIAPYYNAPRLLTWAEVAEILGEKGLPTFFRVYEVSTTTYFEVIDGAKGKLGDGAVRMWYHIQEPYMGKNNGSAHGGILSDGRYLNLDDKGGEGGADS